MDWREEISHIGDIFAIPLFALAIYYFYKIQKKNWIEWILLLFVFIAFICDSYFTYNYLNSLKEKKYNPPILQREE